MVPRRRARPHVRVGGRSGARRNGRLEVGLTAMSSTLTRLPRGDSFADDRIFIAIASYRDPDLPRTIRSAIENAARPA